MKKEIIEFALKKNIDFWDLAGNSRYLPDVTKPLKKIKEEGFVVIKNNKIILTKKGKKYAKKNNLFPKSLPRRKEIKVNNNFLNKFKKYRKRIKEKNEFDQLQILPESIIEKVELMKNRGDLLNKKIICLGDDDSMAIALALTGLLKEIAIIDIDKSILDYEASALKKIGCNFKTIHHSLVNPIPRSLKRKYDVFITEPPDTVEGNTLFFSRGVDCLKENGVGYIGISQNDLSLKNISKIQKNILSMNMVITDIFEKFSWYETAHDEFDWVTGLPKEITPPDKQWFSSNLIRTEAIKKGNPIIKGKFESKLLKSIIYC